MWPFSRKAEPAPPIDQKSASLESILRQIGMMFETVSGTAVNPENCMQSPTVHAIVTAVDNRLSISPVHVLQKTMRNGRTRKEPQPDHEVTRLLKRPNSWQTTEEFFGDAASSLLRHGRFFASKGRGRSGPVRELIPLEAGGVEIKQDRRNFTHFFRYNDQDIRPARMLYARLGSRGFLKGDSPVVDVRESIGLEIAAEKFGSAFFGNGAMPHVFFELLEGAREFETDEEKVAFLQSVNAAFGGNKKFSSMLVPAGMKLNELKVENDKAQFIETRRFIRTVIAGAFGVPPHLVGDLERATFNNVEQQDVDFTINVVMPVAKRLESAMERDLLSDADRDAGIIIRFNLDSVQRADVKTRNESLRIAREWGAINVNEWRELLNLNPISEDDGGEEYVRPMNMAVAGEEPEGENSENPNLRVVDADAANR